MNNLSKECFLRVVRLHRKVLHSNRKHLNELGVTWNQYLVMKNINPDEALTLSEISARALKVNSNVTNLVDFLEQKGIVLRVADPKDRRVVRVKLTNEGAKIREEAIKKHEEFLIKLFSNIEDSDKNEFIEAADKILKGIEQPLQN